MKKMNFRWLFYPFLIFLLGGNVVRYIFGGSLEYILITSILLVLLSVYCIIQKHYKQMIVLLLCFCLGGGLHFVGMASFQPKEYVGKVAVVGRVTDSISEEKYTKTAILDSVKINGENASNIRVEISNCFDELEVGSFISFESELENVHAFTLGTFNTSCYRNGVRYNAECNFKYAVVSEGYKCFDEKVRLSIKSLLYQNMSPVNAETAYASLFGDKSNVDKDVYSSYQGSGIIHILTVSGLHISFLISLIFGLLKRCKVNKFVNFAITSIFILFYAYLCNWTPSVMRAGIMGIVFMLSKLLQRKYDSLNSLGLAGFIICLIRPLTTIDSGFLMSVFCVVGINFIVPQIQKFLAKVFPKGVSETLAVSLSAQIGILPLLCLMGGEINFLSLFTNFIVVPIFGIVFPLLFAICFIGVIIPYVAKLLIVIDYAFTFIGLIAQFFDVDQIKIYIKGMGYVNILLFYVASFVVSDYLVLFGKQKLITIAVVLLCFAFSCMGYYFKKNDLPTISYISKYNQSSIVIKSKSGQTMVVGDCYLLDKFSRKFNVKYDIFVADDFVSENRYSQLIENNFNLLISFEDGLYSENKVLEENQNYIMGDFILTYIVWQENFVGTRVNCNGKEIFIASEKTLDYNEFNHLYDLYNFDIVVADYYISEEILQISNKNTNGSDYSFEKLGNFALNGKNLSLRRLD